MYNVSSWISIRWTRFHEFPCAASIHITVAVTRLKIFTGNRECPGNGRGSGKLTPDASHQINPLKLHISIYLQRMQYQSWILPKVNRIGETGGTFLPSSIGTWSFLRSRSLVRSCRVSSQKIISAWIQWIGSREKIQETRVFFTIIYRGFL